MLVGPSARARGFRGWPGRAALVTPRDVRVRAPAPTVEGRHAVVAGGAGREAGVREGGGRAPGAGHEDGPAGDAVRGRLDPVAGDRAPAVARRRRPAEQQPVGSARPARRHPQSRRRARNGRVGGRACDVRPRAPARPVDRGDPVVAGGAGTQSPVRVGRDAGPRVGLEHPPGGAAGRGRLDPVAGDRGPAHGRRRRPVQLDGRGAPGARAHPPGRVREGDARRGARDVRGTSLVEGVDREDPVVTGRVRREAGVPVPGRGARGAPRQGRPRVAAVVRHLDPVADDVAAALVGRGAPVELDRRDAVCHGRERPRRAGRLALAGVVPDGRELELLREVAGPVPERPGAHVVVEHLDFVAGTDRAGQRQDHLRRVDVDPRHPLGVRVAVPGDEHVEVGGRRDGALVEVLVERDDELVAHDLGAERLGNPGVRLEVVRIRDVALGRVRRLIRY